MTFTIDSDLRHIVGDSRGTPAEIGPLLASDQNVNDNRDGVVGGEPFPPSGHSPSGSQKTAAAGRSLDLPPTIETATPGHRASGATNLDQGQNSGANHCVSALVDNFPGGQSRLDTQATLAPGGIYNAYLCLLSDMLDDLEATRISNENRVRMLTRDQADSDGLMRGLGLDARSPEVASALAMVEGIKALEHKAELDLKRQFRKHPLYKYTSTLVGLGDKQTARLLAVIGDPYWNDLYERPRTVSELWAYSGYSVVNGGAQRRARGVKSNWNDKARSRGFLIAQSCIKNANSPFRKVYDDARTQYADAVHGSDCVRCGPAGKPALAGSPLSLGHQHQRALRRVTKEVLKTLWLASRELHTGIPFEIPSK